MNNPQDNYDEEFDQTVAFDMNDIEAALAEPYHEYDDEDEDGDDFVVDVEEELGLAEPEVYVAPPVRRPVVQAPPPPVRRQQPIPRPKARVQKRTAPQRLDLSPPHSSNFPEGQPAMVNADQPTHVRARRRAVAKPPVPKKSRVHLYYGAAIAATVVGFGAFYFSVYLPAIGKTFVLGIY